MYRLGGVDILVLNHILPHNMGQWLGSGQNLTLMDTLFDVNYRAYVYLASHALDELERTCGSIIVVSSIAGLSFNGIHAQTIQKGEGVV